VLASAPLLAQQFEVYRHFIWPYGVAGGRLALGADGSLYGTDYGGEFGRGEIFRLVPDGSGGFSYERLYSFHGPDGVGPAGVVQGSDGRFYGTTTSGGALGGGTVYGFDLATGLVVFHSFGVDSFYGNYYPDRLVAASDGNLYGLTRYGGNRGWGMVYRVTPAGAFTELHDFAGPEGQRPIGALIQASDGYLYGVATFGGNTFAPAGPTGFGLSGGGTIFRSDFSGNVTRIYVFPGSDNTANGDLVEAPDGYLYGTMFNGPGGTGSAYRSDKLGNATVLHSFPSAPGEGFFVADGLTRAPDGNLYGTTTAGGSDGAGTVFRMTSDGTVTTVASFANGVGNPFYGLTLQPDGTLIGYTFYGGAWGVGTVFRVPLPDSDYEVVRDFGGPLGVSSPSSELVQTADGTLWGTAGGGSAGLGTVFRLSGDPMVVHEFSGTDGATPGNLFAAPDGNLYGVTAEQGSGGSGTIFELGAAGTFATLQAFSGTDGAEPAGGLMQASDGNFYGTTASGGVNGGGTLFRLTSSGTYTKLHDFQANAVPEEPRGRLIQATDGMLYFTGIGFRGTLFQSDLSGNVTDLHDFLDADGEGPPAGVIQADDGNLYGTCRYFGGGDQSLGTVYRFGPPATYAVIHSFSGEGRTLGGVVQGGDGRLYGTTTGELVGGNGGVFGVDLSGANFAMIHEFDGGTGAGPAASLLRAADGMLYGTTQGGGWGGRGVVFRLDPANSPPSIDDLVPASGPASGGVSLTIAGDHFRPGIAAALDDTPFASQDVFDIHTHFGVTPPLTPGTLYDVTVTNTDGQSATLPQAYFADFLDVPTGSLFHDDIEAIFRGGITAGCGGGSYCGGAAVTRSQIAVFILKVEHGAGYAPPACAGAFPDVPCPSMFADWIEQFAAEEITAGCGGGLFCPQGPLPRANGAVLLLKAEHGSSYVPPSCTGVFADVPCPSPFADWIERLAAEGITGGCGNGDYCPDAHCTRGQMAAFLEKTAAKP
jgi:uncharacterized repeat protein (TIGR03803 family)